MNSIRRQAVLAMILLLIPAVARPASSSTPGSPYTRMAPVARYLSGDRQTEIDLARSAAPPSVSGHATIMVLGEHGYQVAEVGTNGFTCLVERSWMAQFDNPEFWNWNMRGPICYNPPASRSVLRYTLARTNLVLAGLSISSVLDRTVAAVASKRLPPPEPGSMSYMLSKNGYLGDAPKAWHPHLMFYAPKADGANDGASWGADLPGSPVILDTSYHIVPEPETIFMLVVKHWSDGSLPVTPSASGATSR
jgi:hypothetical protein